MISLRAIAAVMICKILRLLSRCLHRGGTAMPGRVALKICPDLLRILSKNVRTIAVTGTNGKTTSVRMIERSFQEAGCPCFVNRSGANLMSGIATEFVMNSSLFGKMKKECAVIECDEAAARVVFGQLQPKIIVVTNLFRDQLDRYGEITHTLSNIREGILNTPDAVLCLNADCSLTASLSLDHLPNSIVWYGINQSAKITGTQNGLSDAGYCIRCKTEYEYDYHTYAHLGGFRCPCCGYVRKDPDFAVTGILSMNQDNSDIIMKTPSGEKKVTVNLPAVYNLYNAAAAVAACVSFGLDELPCLSALALFSCGFGRMETFPLGGGARIILIKNPAGCTQALDYLTHVEGLFSLVICLNDRSADGKDISWIWDADFESLTAKADQIKRIYVSGDRAYDMLVRLKYAGIQEEIMRVIPKYDTIIQYLQSEKDKIFILPTYTAMLEFRSALVHHSGGSEFWE